MGLCLLYTEMMLTLSQRSRQRRRNMFTPGDYGTAAPNLGRALEALRQRLLSFQTTNDDDGGAFGLVRVVDILSSLLLIFISLKIY